MSATTRTRTMKGIAGKVLLRLSLNRCFNISFLLAKEVRKKDSHGAKSLFQEIKPVVFLNDSLRLQEDF